MKFSIALASLALCPPALINAFPVNHEDGSVDIDIRDALEASHHIIERVHNHGPGDKALGDELPSPVYERRDEEAFSMLERDEGAEVMAERNEDNLEHEGHLEDRDATLGTLFNIFDIKGRAVQDQKQKTNTKQQAKKHAIHYVHGKKDHTTPTSPEFKQRLRQVATTKGKVKVASKPQHVTRDEAMNAKDSKAANKPPSSPHSHHQKSHGGNTKAQPHGAHAMHYIHDSKSKKPHKQEFHKHLQKVAANKGKVGAPPPKNVVGPASHIPTSAKNVARNAEPPSPANAPAQAPKKGNAGSSKSQVAPLSADSRTAIQRKVAGILQAEYPEYAPKIAAHLKDIETKQAKKQNTKRDAAEPVAMPPPPAPAHDQPHAGSPSTHENPTSAGKNAKVDTHPIDAPLPEPDRTTMQAKVAKILEHDYPQYSAKIEAHLQKLQAQHKAETQNTGGTKDASAKSGNIKSDNTKSGSTKNAQGKRDAEPVPLQNPPPRPVDNHDSDSTTGHAHIAGVADMPESSKIVLNKEIASILGKGYPEYAAKIASIAKQNEAAHAPPPAAPAHKPMPKREAIDEDNFFDHYERDLGDQYDVWARGAEEWHETEHTHESRHADAKEPSYWERDIEDNWEREINADWERDLDNWERNVADYWKRDAEDNRERNVEDNWERDVEDNWARDVEDNWERDVEDNWERDVEDSWERDTEWSWERAMGKDAVHEDVATMAYWKGSNLTNGTNDRRRQSFAGDNTDEPGKALPPSPIALWQEYLLNATLKNQHFVNKEGTAPKKNVTNNTKVQARAVPDPSVNNNTADDTQLNPNSNIPPSTHPDGSPGANPHSDEPVHQYGSSTNPGAHSYSDEPVHNYGSSTNPTQPLAAHPDRITIHKIVPLKSLHNATHHQNITHPSGGKHNATRYHSLHHALNQTHPRIKHLAKLALHNTSTPDANGYHVATENNVTVAAKETHMPLGLNGTQEDVVELQITLPESQIADLTSGHHAFTAGGSFGSPSSTHRHRNSTNRYSGYRGGPGIDGTDGPGIVPGNSEFGRGSAAMQPLQHPETPGQNLTAGMAGQNVAALAPGYTGPEDVADFGPTNHTTDPGANTGATHPNAGVDGMSPKPLVEGSGNPEKGSSDAAAPVPQNPGGDAAPKEEPRGAFGSHAPNGKPIVIPNGNFGGGAAAPPAPGSESAWPPAVQNPFANKNGTRKADPDGAPAKPPAPVKRSGRMYQVRGNPS